MLFRFLTQHLRPIINHWSLFFQGAPAARAISAPSSSLLEEIGSQECCKSKYFLSQIFFRIEEMFSGPFQHTMLTCYGHGGSGSFQIIFWSGTCRKINFNIGGDDLVPSVACLQEKSSGRCSSFQFLL